MTNEPKVTLERIRNRDPEAIGALVKAHHRRLRGYVAALSMDLDAVDDLAQEAFLRTLERLDRVEDLEDFGRFLRGVARNVVREHARRLAYHHERYEHAIEESWAAPQERDAEDPGPMRSLRRCLESLPQRSRRMLDLRYAEERTAEEIGREMGMAAGHVRVLLLRIREALLKCMKSAGGNAVQEAVG